MDKQLKDRILQKADKLWRGDDKPYRDRVNYCNSYQREATQDMIIKVAEIAIKENLTKHNNDFKTKLENIYRACNDERIFEIQNRIGDLLKEISS